MTRMSLFNSPLLLGFERVERLLDAAAKAQSDGYPPYNIEQCDDGSFRIAIAVAGFSAEALKVTLEENQLVIRGKQDDGDERVFLHRGIATRQFQRTFVLAEGIEVKSAALEDGLLQIELYRPKPTPRLQEIEIRAGRPAGTTQLSKRGG